MKSLAHWSVHNRVAVNLLTFTLLIAGFYTAAKRLQLDLFPDVSTNFITVSTFDPTTSLPEDIERTITVPIEEQLSNVEGIFRLRSISQDNFSNIFLEVESSVEDLDPILNEVRQAVDISKSRLPTSAEDPVVEKFDIPFPIVTFSISYPAGFDLRTVRDQIETLRRQLKLVPGVSDVLVDGLEDREIWIEADPYRLQAAGISFEQVVQAVQRKNINRVGGRLDAAGGQRVVRILGEVQEAQELETMPVKTVGSRVLLLRDVATVKEATRRAERLGRTNLERSITFSLVKKKGGDVIRTVDRARQVFEQGTRALPESFTHRVLADSTKYINTRVDTVLKNGLQALILVTALLVMLLNWRLAMVVAFGLPVSFAGCFLVMSYTGHSINLLSLFAMIMALGMVVDDAIVVAENVFRLYQEGHPPAEAAILGTKQVFWPVLGSVTTTVAAFLPLIWGEGIIGKFLAVVPLVVISALVFSLLQAFLVLPSHLADFVRDNRRPTDIRAELEAGARNAFHWLRLQIELSYAELRAWVDRVLTSTTEVYLHLLNISLRRRYIVVAGFVAMLIAMGVAGALGVVRFQLFATDFADRLLIKLELPADATLHEMEDAVRRVEERIVKVLPEDDLVTLITRVGAQTDNTDQFLEYGSNLAMITVDIDEQNPKARKPSAIERDLRAMLVEFPEFSKATAKAEEGGPPVGKAVNAEIQGPDFATMRSLASDLEARLAAVNGVVNIGNDFPRGKTEFQVVVNEERAARVGLDVSSIATALQGGFRGIETSRIRWGNDEVTLRVKMDERFSHDPEILRGFSIANAQGEATTLSAVADLVRTAGVARVKRVNQERVITVSADVEERIITSAQVNELISQWVDDMVGDKPGFSISLTGENEDTERSIEAMKFSTMVALLLIYGLLATITNSFLQPVVIMAVIPFAVVGVFIGLILMSVPLGLMSIMGTIALAGIVVNNSVVFVDFMNRFRYMHAAHGQEVSGKLELTPFVRWRSILASGKTRFRPIFLTTATTVVGLMGLAFTSSGQEQFLAPMAQAIVFGLSFATLITMVLIPCLYAILDDLRGWMHRHFGTSDVDEVRG